MAKCKKCNRIIWFLRYPLWNEQFPCPHCKEYQPNIRIFHGGCKTNPNDPGQYRGEIKCQ